MKNIVMKNFSKNAYIKTMIEDKNEQRKQLLLSKIAQFRLFDDDFMSKVFEDDIEATEFFTTGF